MTTTHGKQGQKTISVKHRDKTVNLEFHEQWKYLSINEV